MSLSQRCDEILRLIDEVIGATDVASAPRVAPDGDRPLNGDGPHARSASALAGTPA